MVHASARLESTSLSAEAPSESYLDFHCSHLILMLFSGLSFLQEADGYLSPQSVFLARLGADCPSRESIIASEGVCLSHRCLSIAVGEGLLSCQGGPCVLVRMSGPWL